MISGNKKMMTTNIDQEEANAIQAYDDAKASSDEAIRCRKPSERSNVKMEIIDRLHIRLFTLKA